VFFFIGQGTPHDIYVDMEEEMERADHPLFVPEIYVSTDVS